MRINSKKNVISDQKYEQYWATTMALTDWNSPQFIRTLSSIVSHIDKYNLKLKDISDVVKNPESNRKQLIDEVTHHKELQAEISNIFANDDNTGATTRKQINEFIKLGFIRPYYLGYHTKAKSYIKAKDDQTRKRLFSDIVYNDSSFNSSQTNDDTKNNQMKFLVNTLINRKTKMINDQELIALMNIDISKIRRGYANEREIEQNLQWFKSQNFQARKYNQISHFQSILRQMEFLNYNNKPFSIFLEKDSLEFLLPNVGSTKRDTYRFGVMKKGVYDESIRVYGKKVSWLTKKESSAYVVSHIKDSAESLRELDFDSAYDPNNALLLSLGDEDQYFDKKKITILSDGNVEFSEKVLPNFISYIKNNKYKIDDIILNDDRKKYLLWHNEKFLEKNGIK